MRFSQIACSVLLSLPALFQLSGCSYTGPQSLEGDRLIIGESAFIHIKELDYVLEARIDTGARTTSIHALDIEIENDEGDHTKNVGKPISYTIVDADGKHFPVSGVIGGTTVVRNAQGTETRYQVPMTLTWQGVRKRIEVNLRDRSKMTYKLLIGRDWLSDDFLVNVDIAEAPPE